MRKILFILLFLPMLLLESCSKDDDLAQVEISLEISGVAKSGNNLYTIQGEDVSVDKIEVTSLTDQNAIIQRVVFSLDGFPLPINIENPFTTSFSTEDLRVGQHNLGMSGVVLQVDKTLTDVHVSVPIIIVESEADLPEDATEIGTVIVTP
ncbi:MAG: hypothetical protein K2J48_00870 [Muribaculaceae bacterium]|nr:hypothetical protein [Muribaculaceae bacterium]